MSNDFVGVAIRAERLERARNQYQNRAAAGTRPCDVFPQRVDPAEVFGPEELDALDALALEVQEQRRTAGERAQAGRGLKQMTAAVLAEWDAARLVEAEQEARRRLGLDGEAA